MESRPQNPEFRNNPENCHPCIFHVKRIDILRSVTVINDPLKSHFH